MKYWLIIFSIVLVLSACSSHNTKRYILSDPTLCENVNFTCEKGSDLFIDDNGCGCDYINLESYSQENDDMILFDCPEIYTPVCAKIQPKCEDKCSPLWQNFPNDCFAKQSGAMEVKTGQCP